MHNEICVIICPYTVLATNSMQVICQHNDANVFYPSESPLPLQLTTTALTSSIWAQTLPLA